MEQTDKSNGRSTNMSSLDWLEMKELIRGAEGAILSGTLNEWQHASTSTFHILASALLDLNERISAMERSADDRLARLESATNQPVECASNE